MPPIPLWRRLLHRVPVRVRHYWKLLAGCVAFALVLTLAVNTVRIRPYVTSSSDDSGSEVTQDIAGTVDLFDATKAHTIRVSFRDADYQRMLDGFYSNGEKEYVEADLTVDGTTIPSVGIRLKGNSTLAGLTRNGEARQGGGFGQGGRPGGGFPGGGPRGGVPRGGVPQPPATGAAAAPGAEAAPPDANRPGANIAPGGPAGFGRASLKAEEPETLPWLIRFDEFVDGRRYQGHREVAVRVAGMGGGSTVLSEAVSLNLLASTGEVAQEYTYSSFTVNDRPTTARLLVEHPDENFAEDMDGSGVLYKSLATGQFTDQGDDPTDYQDDFKQITMKGSQDLQPVIDLIKWVNTASDTEFNQQLGDRIDVESFARYVAWQNLLLNFDDMAGPGRNYYLWYDLTTKKFTVIGWDYNLTFSGNAEQGPHEQGRLGGGSPGGGPGGVGPPAGMQLPDGFTPPEGFQPPGGDAAGDKAGRGGAPAGFAGRGGHKLKERFLASATFKTGYEDAYRSLYQQVYGSGKALTALDTISKVLSTVDGYDAQKTSEDAGKLRTLIQQRTASLAKDEVVNRG